jgi:ABC-type transporter Mla subunit MlaD
MAAELEQLRVSLVAELVGREAFEQLKREVNQVRAATSGLDAAQTSLRRTTDATADAVRRQRQAFTQGGMQINQFAGQIAAGTPVSTAFVQQIGDISYVVGQAGGSLGKFGAFLGGPWASGIIVAISVLVPLIGYMNDLQRETIDLTDYAERSEKAIKEYYSAIGYTPPIQDAIKASKALINQLIAEGEAALKNAEAHYLRMQIVAKSNMSKIRPEGDLMRKIFGDNPAEKMAAASVEVIKLQGRIEILRKSLQQKSNAKKESGPKMSVPKIGADIKKEADQIDPINTHLESVMKNLNQYSTAYGQTTRDNINLAASAFAEQQKLNEVIKDNQAAKNLEEMYKPIDKIKSASEAMGQAFSDGIKGMITGAMSFKQVMSSVIDTVINKLFEMFVVQQIVGFIGKGISAATGIPLTPRAIGGPVQSGNAYMVGERGPEMFVPSRSGSIVPNGGMGGGINISVDARGASDPAAVRQQVELGIAQAAPYIIAAAQSRTLKTAGRARLPGAIG